MKSNKVSPQQPGSRQQEDASSLATNSSARPIKKKRVTPEQRWRMIEEAAYYRAEKRGFVGEQLADDWTAAEAEIDHHYEVDLSQTMQESDPGRLVEQLAKAFSGPRFGGIDVGEVLKAQRKNIEALTVANQQALKGARLLLVRQAELLQDVLQDAADSIKALAESNRPTELIEKQDAILQSARTRALAQMREMAEIVAQSQARALNTIRERMQAQSVALSGRLMEITRKKPR